MPSYTITINGVNRTREIVNKRVIIEDSEGHEPSRLEFTINNRDGGAVPEGDQEVIITQDGVRLFGGRILKVIPHRLGEFAEFDCYCVDYTRDLDRNLVVQGYQSMTDKQIIEDIVNQYCGGTGITYTNVTEGVTVSQVAFNYMPPSQCFTQLAELTGRMWYIDYSKDIHYGLKNTETAPFDINTSGAEAGNTLYKNLQIIKDNAIIKNRVYIRGGTYLSDSYTITQIADGEQTVFWLPEKPYELAVSEGATSKTVGTKFIHSSDDYDYLVNFQEKYVEATVAPTADTVMTFTFKYDIPVLVAIEDPDSIEAYGQLEYVIFDKNIRTITQARERALAELTDYADTMVSGSFQTEETGFQSGQYMDINISNMGINDEFFVSKVVAKSIGSGNFVYTVFVTSSTVKGIINFLIGLLESDKQTLNITRVQTVDEISIQTPEEFTIDDDVPVLTDHSGDYVWDASEWNLAAWKKPT
jgi:hypothetical protein